MSFKSMRSELSELQAERKTTPENILVSSNGIRYKDPRPLKYCKEYSILVKPTMKCCRHCDHGREVLELVEEQREMFLDPESGALLENAEDIIRPVSEINRVDGKRTDSPETIPVTALLKIATVKIDDKNAMLKIVFDRFHGMTDCPRNSYCKP